MGISDVVIVDMYVNPSTSKVEKITCITPFGMTERTGSDWEPVSRDESGIDDLSTYKVYRLDWDTDFIPLDSDEPDRDHAAIELFDKGNLTESDCQKYGNIHIDPTNC